MCIGVYVSVSETLELELQIGCELLCGYRESNPGCLEEQTVLLAPAERLLKS